MPRTQGFTPARHFCVQKNRVFAILQYRYALIQHIVQFQCTTGVQHLSQELNFWCNVLVKWGINVFKFCRVQHFSAQKFLDCAHSASSGNCTSSIHALGAQFAPSMCKSGAQRSAATHLVCMKYTARVYYTVSARIGDLYAHSVHCQWNRQCTVQFQCTL